MMRDHGMVATVMIVDAAFATLALSPAWSSTAQVGPYRSIHIVFPRDFRLEENKPT